MTPVEFLEAVRPGGPWGLVSIHPDKKSLRFQAFQSNQTSEMSSWIESENRDRNIYFHVNPLLRYENTKASKEDVAALEYLYVDVDPRVGEDVIEEQARILALMQGGVQGVPLPTFTVFSGGGYQALWRLEAPIVVGGDIAAAEAAECYNRQLEVLFGADSCHNCDRIFRVAGTTNFPDAKKKAKGRVIGQALVVEYAPERVYPLSDFIAAAPKQAPPGEALGFVPADTVISGNVPRLASVDELPETVSERIKVIIVQGEDPDNPTRFESRSEWLFWVCCELVRAGVSDEIIYSVITDPGFLISRSVLDKKSRVEAYALHQIRRARDYAEDPLMLKLNEQFAVIGNIGGKCRVIEEFYDNDLKRGKITKQSFDDFGNRFMHKKVQCGVDKKNLPVMMPLGRWWLSNEKRRQYDTIVFSPEREVKGSYNLWRGFAYDAKPGDCSLFLQHVFDNICNGNQDHYDYLFAWMASAVQKPAQPGETAVVLRGKMGTGKGYFVRMFGSLWGRHFLHISQGDHMTGHFNQHLRDCVVLFADEAFYAGDKRHEATLKALVTEPTIMYEPKGYDSESGANFLHILMASNSSWVVPAGAEERRFFVLDVGEERIQQRAYFAAISKQMDEGGREALLHALKTYPLDNFVVSSVPKTRALVDQKIFSLSAEDAWWIERLSDGRVLPHHDKWETRVSKADLFDAYVSHMTKVRRNFVSNSVVLGRFLHRVVPALHQSRGRVEREAAWGGEKTYRDEQIYIFPSLAECRARWEAIFGSALGQWDANPVDTVCDQ